MDAKALLDIISREFAWTKGFVRVSHRGDPNDGGQDLVRICIGDADVEIDLNTGNVIDSGVLAGPAKRWNVQRINRVD